MGEEAPFLYHIVGCIAVGGLRNGPSPTTNSIRLQNGQRCAAAEDSMVESSAYVRKVKYVRQSGCEKGACMVFRLGTDMTF